MRTLIKIASQREIVISSVKVSFIVGLILNLINQGDVILSLQFDQINLINIVLTFLVPFMVSSYATAKTKLDLKIGDKAIINMDIECKQCNTSKAHLHKGDLVPECEICRAKSEWVVVD